MPKILANYSKKELRRKYLNLRQRFITLKEEYRKMSDIKQMIDELISENINLKSRLQFIENASIRYKQALERAEENRLELEHQLNVARFVEEKVSLKDYEKLEFEIEELKRARQVSDESRDLLFQENIEKDKLIAELQEITGKQSSEIARLQSKSIPEISRMHQRMIDVENKKVTLESFIEELDQVFYKFGYSINY